MKAMLIKFLTAVAICLCSFFFTVNGYSAEKTISTENITMHDGAHELRTNNSNESIVWRVRWFDKINMRSGYQEQRFSNIENFKTTFLKSNPPKTAHIEIVGMWNHSSRADTNTKHNETLLLFLRNHGYDEFWYKVYKKDCPFSCNNIGVTVIDNNQIIWLSRKIISDHVYWQTQTFSSLDDFTKAFTEAELDKQAKIEINAVKIRPKDLNPSLCNSTTDMEKKFEGRYSRITAIFKYLQEAGYNSIKLVTAVDPDL